MLEQDLGDSSGHFDEGLLGAEPPVLADELEGEFDGMLRDGSWKSTASMAAAGAKRPKWWRR